MILGHLCLLIRFTQRKSKLSCILMTGSSFTNWSKVLTEVRLQPSTETERQECCLPPCLHFKGLLSEHWGARILSNQCFPFLWLYIQEWNCWIIWQFYFQFFEEPPYCFPQWLHKFTFPPTVQEGSLFSTSSPTLVICRLLYDSHSGRCEVISHYLQQARYGSNLSVHRQMSG